MAKVVIFGNMKGGVGKSTTTLLTACALSQKPFNKKVLVLDFDRQKSLSELRELDKQEVENFSFDIRSTTVKSFYESLDQLDKDFDYVFLDAGGILDNNLSFEQQSITPLLLNSDILIVPFVAGNFGTDATIQYLQNAIEVKNRKAKSDLSLSIVGFVNMYIKNRREDRQLSQYLDELASETGLQIMRNRLGFYSAYRSIDTIRSLYKEKPKDSQELNFKLWIKELSKILENG